MNAPPRGVLAGIVMALLAGCKSDQQAAPSSPAPTLTIASVTISPTLDSLHSFGDTARFTAQPRDRNGALVSGRQVSWSSSPGTVASIDGTGLATAIANGTATISAVVQGVVGIARALVLQVAANVTLAPAADTIRTLGATRQFTATVRDARGNQVSSPSVAWSSGSVSIASVSPSGVVTAVADGITFVRGSVGGVSGTAQVVVATSPVALVMVRPTEEVVLVGDTRRFVATLIGAAGDTIVGPRVTWSTSNALATIDSNGVARGVGEGQSGVNVRTPSGKQSSALLSVFSRPQTGLRHVALSAGSTACSLGASGAAYCWGPGSLGSVLPGNLGLWPYPRPVSGGPFRAVSTAAGSGACGLGIDNRAYCWGGTPTLVHPTIQFAALTVGGAHACGLLATGEAYCWGSNLRSVLGSGIPGGLLPSSSQPLLVAGGHRFATISASVTHTCAVTLSGSALCWGANFNGQLGDGSGAEAFVPVPVAGSRTFSAISAGGFYTCGLTTAGTAYCWGSGRALGRAITYTATPVEVTTSLVFSSITTMRHRYAPAGGTNEHTCALTATGEAWCWGPNAQGQLGNGSLVDSPLPSPVAGSLRFRQLAAGQLFTCGVALSGELYCWGYNDEATLGDGTLTSRSVPTAVITN